MNIKKINVLQHKLFDKLNEYYHPKGFIGNREDWSFSNGVSKVLLYVDTKIGDFYTVRPGLDIIHIDLINKINQLKEEHKISWSSYFLLDHKLANTLGIKDFDICEENNFGKNQFIFRHNIGDESDVEKFVRRHILIMESFGLDIISICENEKSYYTFLKKGITEFLEDLSINKDKRMLDRPLRLTRESLLTFIYLAFQKGDSDLEEIIDSLTIFFSEPNDIIIFGKKLLN